MTIPMTYPKSCYCGTQAAVSSRSETFLRKVSHVPSPCDSRTPSADNTAPSILFYRNAHGIGDLAMMVRSVELTRLKYPKAKLFVQCKYPDLIKDHPAIDSVLALTDKTPDTDFFIDQSTVCGQYEFETENISKPRQQIFCENAQNVLGAEELKWDNRPQTLYVSRELRQWGEVIVENASEEKMPLGLFWQSAEMWRTWKPMAKLAEMLSEKFAVFCFDGSEKINVQGVHDIVGYSLDKVLALVSRMRLIISNDSVGIHLAGSLGVPILGIFGATSPLIRIGMYPQARWMSVECPRHPCWYDYCSKLTCLKKIKPPDVYNKAMEMLRTQFDIPGKRKVQEAEGVRTVLRAGVTRLAKGKACALHRTATDIKIPCSKPLSHQDNIVIVRMKGIGDVLISWFGLEAFRKKYPDTHITYVTSQACSELFYNQENFVDRVIASKWDYPPEGIPKLPKEISGIPHDMLIDLTNRVDFHDVVEKVFGDKSILHTKPRADNFAWLMDVDIDCSIPIRMLKIPAELTHWASEITHLFGKKPIISCQLDSKGATRLWRIERWKQLSELLVKAGYGVIWFGVTPEYSLLKQDGVLNTVCRLTLAQMIALMSKCRYAISTCSASVHIAARLPNTTPIGIYGSTDYKLLGAYYDDLIPITNYSMDCAPCVDWGHECLGQPGAPWCINQISPKRIINVIHTRCQRTPSAAGLPQKTT